MIVNKMLIYTSTWLFDKEEAIFGAKGDLGVHKADLVRWVIGEEFTKVSSFVTVRNMKYNNGEPINIEDNAVCILQSESGIVGTLAVSWTYYGGESNATIFNCEKAFVDLFVEITRNNFPFPLEELVRVYENLKEKGMIDKNVIIRVSYGRSLQYDIRFITESKFIHKEAFKFVSILKGTANAK